jgi:hypothetical protein
MPALLAPALLDGDQQTIVCIYCDRPIAVGRRAMSLPCRHCHRALRVEDVRLTGYEARRVIETCGMVFVGEKGNVAADRIVCSSLVVMGRLKASVTCHGRAVLRAGADFRGDLTAHSLEVEAGAKLRGMYRVCPVEANV